MRNKLFDCFLGVRMTMRIFLVLSLSIAFPASNLFGAGYGGGTGTVEDPFLIATAEQLVYLGTVSSDWDSHFKLVGDLYLSGSVFNHSLIAPDTDPDSPGFQGTAFTGSFEGNNHRIYDLTIYSSTGRDYLGLFGYTDNAHINNIGIERITITAAGSGSSYVGGLAGYQDHGVVSHSHVSGLISGDSYIGGLAGYSSGTIVNSYSQGVLSGIDTLGGLVGWSEGDITDCSAQVEMTGANGCSCIGGLVGVYAAGLMGRNYSTGFIQAGNNSSYIGGLAGRSERPLTLCYSMVHITGGTGSHYMGGLAGGSGSDITNCYADSNVSGGKQSSCLGGLAGLSEGHILNCYSAGAVTAGDGGSYVGGLVGRSLGTVANSFWDTQTSHCPSSDGGTGLTTAELMQEATYAGWDFFPSSQDGTPAEWMGLRGWQGYPVLAWQKIAGDITGSYDVDIEDLVAVAAFWLADCSVQDCQEANLIEDGSIDMEDFVILAKNWLFKQGQRPDEKIPVTTDNYAPEDLIVTGLPEVVADSVADNFDLINAADTTNYLWGYSFSNQKVYRKSKTAGDWTLVPGPLATSLWADGGSRIVAFNGVASGACSADEGASWQPITAMPVITEGGGIFATNWSMAFSPTAVVLVEYDNSLDDSSKLRNGRKIFRSADNGRTWNTVKDVQDSELYDAMAQNTHFHSVGYHAATGTFIAAMGDGNRCFYRSSDDGLTWTQWLANAGMQPIQIVDYGHPTRILCGSDMFGGVHWLDLDTEYAFPLLYNRLTQTANGQGYVWILKRCNGIFYAFQYDSSSQWPKYAKVWVSSNGQDWGTYYQFTGYLDGQYTGMFNGGRYISGAAQGYIHVTIDGEYNFKLKEAALSSESCALVLPKFKNLLDSDNKSHFTADSTAWASYGVNHTFSRVAEGLFGDYSLGLAKGDPGSTSYAYLVTALNQARLIRNGRNYVGHIWLKGNVGNNYGFATVQGTAGISGQSYFWTKCPDKWIDVITLPDKVSSVGAEDSNGRINVYLGSSSSPYNQGASYEVNIGGASIGGNPTTFVPGGTERHSGQLIYYTVAQDGWTSFLTLFPDAAYVHLKDYYDPWSSSLAYDAGDYVSYGGKIYKSETEQNYNNRPPAQWMEVTSPAELPRYHIKTWDMGHGNKLVLYLDCCPSSSNGRKIKLDIYKNGEVLKTLGHASAFIWERRSQINVAISVGEDIRMYFWYTGMTSPEEIIGADANIKNALTAGYLKNSLITHRYGDDGVYESLTFCTPFPNNKDFSWAMDNQTGDITREMNNIGQ
ncbi:MAG: hypothetical protein L0Y36_03630 [Planctomycetales bacterium]|nr:hypothetical protein [Planctomycetales bacterium]